MGALQVTHERAFTDLLSVDVVRGAHSTGMASYSPLSKDINIAKDVGSPSNLIRGADYLKSMARVNRLLLGHNRYATKGKINKENAHPFKHGHIVGAHNGSLSFSGQCKLEDKDNKFDTDSEAIMWSLSTRGFEETYRLLANPVYKDNAFALTWFDTKQNKLCIIRNKKRPLFYAYTEKGEAIFWASELGMLQWIIFRNGLSSSNFKTFSVNEDTLYEWEIAKSVDAIIEAPKMTHMDVPEPLYVESTVVTNYPHSHHSSGLLFPPTTSANKNIIKFPTDERVKNFRPPYKTDQGYVIGKHLVNSITDSGCFYCGMTNFKWGDFGFFPSFGPQKQTEYLCKECYLDPEIKQIVMDCCIGE